MGLINNLRKNKKDKKKEVAKKVATKAILSTIIAILKKVLIGVLLILAIGGFFTYLIGRITSEETPKTIYKELEIEDIKELVIIKGNNVDGYHLEFRDDFDEKLDKLTETLVRREGNRSLNENDQELLKKMFKAEMINQFPDLGGEIEEDNENQFQGAVHIRRVTPNKEIGEMKNTGAGEKVTEDDLKQENLKNQEITYEKGQKLKTKARTKVYLKGEYNFLGKQISKDGVTDKISTMLSQIEGIDKTIRLSKGEEVYYTGNKFFYDYNTYLEVEKEQNSQIVTGYIKNIDVELPDQTTKQDNQEEEENKQEGTGKKILGEEEKNYTIAIAARTQCRRRQRIYQ